jgi:hypothetical protein
MDGRGGTLSRRDSSLPPIRMNRPRRLALLLIPLAIELVCGTLPGRAQQAESSRFAFADTTLLRDTLGLAFDRLFPLADSLRITPDTLRALSIRYRYRLDRLVSLADSMRVPVDSVGPILDRERFNPLAINTAAHRVITFRYNSGYNIAQTSSTWLNGADYNLADGPVFVHNLTNIQMDRYQARTSERQTRSSVTEGGWKFSPNFSLGGRANLERFDSSDPGSLNNDAETKNEFQFSMRTRQQPAAGVRSELNFFSGLLDVTNFQQIKRGVSGDLNGSLRLERGRWLTHDLTGQLNGNVARTGLPATIERATSHDFSTNLNGTLGLYSNTPSAVNLHYTVRRVTVETPLASTVRETLLSVVTPGTIDTVIEHPKLSLQRVRNNSNGADFALRLRQNRDRYVNLTTRYGTSDQFTLTQLNAETHRREYGYGFEGRYLIAGWNVDGNFANSWAQSRFPARAITDGRAVGYGESLHTASIGGSATRTLGPMLVLKVSGRVTLAGYRYYLIGNYPNAPVNRDAYLQNYRIDGNYLHSEKLNSSMALDVTRSLSINIPSASTGANTQTDTYRAEWRWSYRMLRGLTATQVNTLSADYLRYVFLPKNNRLSLDYSALTTLNATPSPRLTMEITHQSRFQPSGNYTVLADGLQYLSRSDESQNYTLRARMSYTPTPVLSLVMTPDYQANSRDAAGSEGLTPQRRSRSLNFSAGASVNLPLGANGRLTGDILRSYRADRSFTFTPAGEQIPTPRSQTDYWNGNLQLTWEL